MAWDPAAGDGGKRRCAQEAGQGLRAAVGNRRKVRASGAAGWSGAAAGCTALGVRRPAQPLNRLLLLLLVHADIGSPAEKL